MGCARSCVPLMMAFFVAAAAMAGAANAWSNGGYSWDPANPDYGTHDWIAEAALALQTRDSSFLTGDNLVRFLLGTEAPDNDDYIGDHDEHHVYYYATGVLQDDAAAVRADDMYDLALLAAGEGRQSDAAYYLGAMTHYISDVGVFGHTMGADTNWGYEEHHSDYEEEFESILDTLETPAEAAYTNRTAYDATVYLARNITFGDGMIRANTWMDDNYDWADSEFVASAMASIDSSVIAVSSAIDHFLWETGAEASDVSPGDDSVTDGAGDGLMLYIAAAVAAAVAVLALAVRRAR